MPAKEPACADGPPSIESPRGCPGRLAVWGECDPDQLHETKGDRMLKDDRVAAGIPVRDLGRARKFYADKLGLEPSEERPGGLLYRCASGEFALFESAGASSGTHTQIAWEVDDIEATVAELKE